MHRRTILLLTLLICPAGPVLAQSSAPAVEIFGGYSMLTAGPDDFPRQTSHGFQVDAAANFTNWLALAGGIGVQFDTARDLGPGFAGRVAESRVTEILFGPRFTARAERAAVFAHGLFGRVVGDAGETFSGFSDSGLAFGGGAGIDVQVQRRLALRTQVDLLASFADIAERNVRFAVGLVVGFGGHTP